MMESLLRCCVLVSIVTVGMSLICQFPHCDTMECPPVDKENCTGTVKLGGGYCGCCMACFTSLYEGDPCTYKDPVDSLIYPNTDVCVQGLHCDRNTSTCQPGTPWVVG